MPAAFWFQKSNFASFFIICFFLQWAQATVPVAARRCPRNVGLKVVVWIVFFSQHDEIFCLFFFFYLKIVVDLNCLYSYFLAPFPPPLFFTYFLYFLHTVQRDQNHFWFVFPPCKTPQSPTPYKKKPTFFPQTRYGTRSSGYLFTITNTINYYYFFLLVFFSVLNLFWHNVWYMFYVVNLQLHFNVSPIFTLSSDIGILLIYFFSPP